MHFLDDALLPENQQKLVIQVAPYGPQWVPGDSDDIPVTMDEQIQKAVDCWNAGATVLHVHVREAGPEGHVQVTHDETGETHTLHRDHLANLLEDHHAEEVRTVQEKKSKAAEKKRLALPKSALELARIITLNNDNKIRQADTYGNATARTLDSRTVAIAAARDGMLRTVARLRKEAAA
mgnify:CR=1 FL=1